MFSQRILIMSMESGWGWIMHHKGGSLTQFYSTSRTKMSISARTLTNYYSFDLNLFNWNNIWFPSFLNIDHQSGSLAGDATSLLILNGLLCTLYMDLYMYHCNWTHHAVKKLTLPYLFAEIQDPRHWPMSTSAVLALSASFLKQLIFPYTK